MEVEREEVGRWMVLYQLIVFYKDVVGTLQSTDLGTECNRGNRRDIERLCEIANLQLSLRSPKWVAHSQRL